MQQKRPDPKYSYAPQTLEKAVANRAIGAGLLFPWNQAYAGNGFGLFRDLTEVLDYVMKETRR
jgi:hypothetical protein